MALNEATVDEIADLLKNTGNGQSQLCLLIGAGVSKSAGIGLASDFIQRIKIDFPSLYQRACKDSGGDKPTYAQCMAALPPAKQVELIRADIDQSLINWGHIGIARLERGGMVDAILTTNFDPLASRACALFHQFPAIYDLAGLRDGQSNQIDFDKSYVKGSAIFHLHGQHTGFLLLNTEQRLEAQAARIKPVLDAVMKGKPVIIAGYSGENDPLIDKIAALAPFNHGLFWVCHNESDPAPNVCRKLLSLDNCQIVRNMPSDQFFTDLANKLELDAPGFLASPFNHMAEVLAKIRPYSDLGEQSGSDLLKSAQEMLKAASKRQREDQPNFAEIADWMAKGAYAKVWQKYWKSGSGLRPEDRDNVAWAGVMLANAISERAETKSGAEAAKLFRQAGEKYAAALAIKPDHDGALNNWGNALAGQARTKSGANAAELFRQSGEKFAAALAIKPDHDGALNNWGAALAGQAKAKSGADAAALLALAGEKYAAANAIEAGCATYNLACLSAVNGDANSTAKLLIESWKGGTNFPGCDHLRADKDFDGVRDHAVFRKAVQKIGC